MGSWFQQSNIACNGEEFLASQFIPAAAEVIALRVRVTELSAKWDQVRAMLRRADVIRVKERLTYLSLYLPHIEELPASEFFREYLSRLQARFSAFRTADTPLLPPVTVNTRMLHLPVTLTLRAGQDVLELGDAELARNVMARHQNVLIIGDPGSGKSNLCARLMTRITEQALLPAGRVVPVHVRLGEGMPASVSQALELACRQMGIRFLPSLFQAALERSDVIAVLDGLDEAGDPAIVAVKLTSFMRSLKRGSVVLTSRPVQTSAYGFPITEYGFVTSSIRPLTNEEVESVFAAYLQGSADSATVIRRLAGVSAEVLRSPLLALMAVRVAVSGCNWDHVTQFDLYTRYVQVLHDYFNALTVRGKDNPLPLPDVLAGLTMCAQVIREGRINKNTITLDELTIRAKAEHREGAVAALLNAGIVTSIGGRAAFIHPAFEDFGYARHVVAAVRARDPEAFGLRHCSVNDLEIAHTALKADDEVQLRAWLSDPKKSVRQRAARLLCMGCGRESLDRVFDRLPKEKTTGTLGVLARTMLAHGDIRFRDWLAANAAGLKKHKLKKVTFHVLQVGGAEYTDLAVALAAALPKSHELAIAAFDLCLRQNRVEMKDELLRIYERSDRSRKMQLVTALSPHLTGPFGFELAVHVIRSETSPLIPIALLKMCRGRLNDMPAAVIDGVCELLKKEMPGSLPVRAPFRKLDKAIREMESPQPALVQLAGLCRLHGGDPQA